MGVKGLWQLLAPVARPVKLETMEGKRLAIDSSIWIYQFQATLRTSSGTPLVGAHILGFLRRINKLLFHGIKPVFVFDGGAPEMKRRTINERRKTKSSAAMNHAQVAAKLLNANLRRRALMEAEDRKKKSLSNRRRLSAAINSDSDDNNRAPSSPEPPAIRNTLDHDSDTGIQINEDTVFLDDYDSKHSWKGKGRAARGPEDNAGLSYRVQGLESSNSHKSGFVGSSDEEADGGLDPILKSSVGISMRQEKKKKVYVQKDPYNLPPLSSSAFKAPVNTTDPRLATEAELQEFMAQAHMKPEDLVDPSSSDFGLLPPEVQYEILQDLWKGSRAPNYARLQAIMNSTGGDPLAFSKAQVLGVARRNELTMRLWGAKGFDGQGTEDDLSGGQGSGGGSRSRKGRRDMNIKIRLGNERNREYVLVRKDGEGGGWVLGIKNEGTSKEAAIPIEVEDDSGDEDEDDATYIRRTREGTLKSRILAADAGMRRTREERSVISIDDEMDEEEEFRKSSFQAQAPVDEDLRELRRENVLSALAARYTPTKPLPKIHRASQTFGPARAEGSKPLFQPGLEEEDDPELSYALQLSVQDHEAQTEAEELATAVQMSIFNQELPSYDQHHEVHLISSDDDDDLIEIDLDEVDPMAERVVPEEMPAGALMFLDDDEDDDNNITVVQNDDPVEQRRKLLLASAPNGAGLESAKMSFSRAFNAGRDHSLSSSPPPTLIEKLPVKASVSVVPWRNVSNKLGSMSTFVAASPVELKTPAALIQVSGEKIEEIFRAPPRDEGSQRPPVDASPDHGSIMPTSLSPDASLAISLPSPPAYPQPLRTELPSRTNSSSPSFDNSADVTATAEGVQASPRAMSSLQHFFTQEPYYPEHSLPFTGPSVSSHDVVLPNRATSAKFPVDEDVDEDDDPVDWSRSPTPPLRAVPYTQGTYLKPGDELDLEEDQGGVDMNAEENDYARFMAQVTGKNLGQVQEEIDKEIKALQAQQKTAMRDEGGGVVEEATAQIQIMLRLFGIPYITAPKEAEAQCAVLASLNLVDGVITDDSDVFLFGGTQCFKNIFNDSKYAEVYILRDLKVELSLSRDRLITLAYLLGSDYTLGVDGVGHVTAMELLAEFPADGLQGLIDFKIWWTKVDQGKDTEEDTNTKWKKSFKKKWAGILDLPPDFPNQRVRDAYLEPDVDESDEPFQWGFPDLDQLRTFLSEELSWSVSKIDDELTPIIQRLARRSQAVGANKQSSIDTFFDTSAGSSNAFVPRVRDRAHQPSKRLQAAIQKYREAEASLQGLAGEVPKGPLLFPQGGDGSDDSGTDSDSEEERRRQERKAEQKKRKAPQRQENHIKKKKKNDEYSTANINRDGKSRRGGRASKGKSRTAKAGKVNRGDDSTDYDDLMEELDFSLVAEPDTGSVRSRSLNDRVPRRKQFVVQPRRDSDDSDAEDELVEVLPALPPPPTQLFTKFRPNPKPKARTSDEVGSFSDEESFQLAITNTRPQRSRKRIVMEEEIDDDSGDEEFSLNK